MKPINILVNNEDFNIRVDKLLASKLGISRTTIQKLIKSNNVLANGRPILSIKEKFSQITDIVLNYIEPEIEYEIIGENIPLSVLYEDEFIVVINKPAGMVCHPAPGHKSGTLVNALINRFQLSDLNPIRPGIIHRLDKDTSGVMIVAKNNAAHNAFASMLANSKGTLIKRNYLCICWSAPNNSSGKIETYIVRHTKNRQMFTTSNNKGKLATTLYKVLDKDNLLSLLKCELLTGRTHQIRVHMKYLNCPIVGDQLYGINKMPQNVPEIIKSFNRQALHSYTLSFMHPFFKREMFFKAEVPKDMQLLMSFFNQDDLDK